jgi:hypothetical protein
MATLQQEKDFMDEVVKKLFDGSLDRIIKWVGDNFDPREVFTDKRILEYVEDTFVPGEVFGESDLETWAREAGSVKADNA